MSKHTPGPWTAQSFEEAIMVYNKDLGPAQNGGYVATIHDFLYDPNREKKKANADLIAAAPQLLGCLIRMRDEAMEMGTWGKHRATTIGAVLKAIAKAEGRDNE